MSVGDRVSAALTVASLTTQSDDPLVQLAWLIEGMGLWYKTEGKVGNSPMDTKRAVLSRFVRASDPTCESTPDKETE